MNSQKKTARIAGILYLMVGIFGGFAEGYVDPKMYVAGNAAVTFGNLIANEGLVRMGVVAHLMDGVFFVFTAMVLYSLLQHVHKSTARAMLILVVISSAITSLNSVFLFEGLRVAIDSHYSTGAAGGNAFSMVMILLDIEHYGIFIAQVFFGLWLAPLGYLANKSGFFPKILGYSLIIGALCYIIDLLAAFLAPEIGLKIHGYITIPSAIAEISMMLYLLIVGVRKVRLDGPLETGLNN